MNAFDVNPDSLIKNADLLAEIKQAMHRVNRDLDGVLRNETNASLLQVRQSLNKLQSELEKETVSMNRLSEVLGEIGQLYRQTEQRILGEQNRDTPAYERLKNIWEKMKTEIQNVLQGFLHPGCVYGGDPVNLQTGNYIAEAEDIKMEGMYPVSFKRYYNSLSDTAGVLGKGWTHSYTERLQENESEWILHRADGGAVYFIQAEDGGFCSVHGQEIQAKKDGNGYLLTLGNLQKKYNSNGYIEEIHRGDGNDIFFCYEEDILKRAEGSFGSIEFFYDKKGRIRKLKSSDGSVVRYRYQGDLLTDVYVNEEKISYEYQEDGALVRMIQPAGNVSVCNIYDEKRRVTEQRFPDGGFMKYRYEDGKTQFTRQNGIPVIYEFDEYDRHIRTLYSDGEESFTYNQRNQKTSFTDKLGRVTRFSYDGRGNLTMIMDPAGQASFMTYDAEGRLISVKRPNGAQTSWMYDERGNRIRETDPLGRTMTAAYDAEGRLTKTVSFTGSVSEFTYDEKGNLISICQDGFYKESFAYDSLNRRSAHVDAFGFSRTYEYNANGRIAAVLSGTERETEYRYTANGKTASVCCVDGGTRCYDYNELDMLSSFSDELGNTIRCSYDSMWNLKEKEMPSGARFQYEYDEQNRLKCVLHDGKPYSRYTYDPAGNIESITNALEQTVFYEYDLLNRLTRIRTEESTMVSYGYDEVGNLLWERDGDGMQIFYEYDLLGRCTAVKSGDGSKYTMEFDEKNHCIVIRKNQSLLRKEIYEPCGLLKEISFADGTKVVCTYNENKKIIRESFSSGLILDYTYDERGRLIREEDQNGGFRAYTYDSRDRLLEETDANGNRRSITYDCSGNITSETDADGTVRNYSYDAMNNLVGISEMGWTKDEEGHSVRLAKETVYERDTRGRVIKVRYPDQREICYSYDALERVCCVKRSSGDEILLSYTPGGDVRQISYSDGRVIQCAYDGQHRLKELKDWNGHIRIRRDMCGRVLEILDYDGHKIEYGYTDTGERSYLQAEGQERIKYLYDDSGRLSKIRMGDYEVSFAYNAQGKLMKKEKGFGCAETYQYDVWGRVARWELWKEDKPVKQITYGYDGNGRRVLEKHWSIKRETEEIHYSYDEMNRLTEENSSQTGSIRYVYDSFGNRIQKTEPHAETHYVYTIGNQLKREWKIAENPAESYEKQYMYDLNGNLTEIFTHSQKGDDRVSYLYDSQDHLKELKRNGVCTEYVYSGLGFLLEKYCEQSGDRIRYDLDYTRRWNPLLGQSVNGRHQTYLKEDVLEGVISKEGLSLVWTDIHGSVTGLYDPETEKLTEIKYDAFGKAAENSVMLPVGYAGCLWDDAAGLYSLQERFYDAATGRFNREDPLFLNEYASDSSNRYIYCFNDPLNFVDRDGCWPRYVQEGAVSFTRGIMSVNRSIQRTANGFGKVLTRAYLHPNTAINSAWNAVSYNASVKKEDLSVLHQIYSDPNYHYNRNQNNQIPEQMSEIFRIDENGRPVGVNGWSLMGEADTMFHRSEITQGESAKYNMKFVKKNPDGSSSEVVICFKDPANPYIVSDPYNAGTYNYCDKDTSKVGHFMFDVLPYWIYGNHKEDGGIDALLIRMIGYNVLSAYVFDIINGNGGVRCLT